MYTCWSLALLTARIIVRTAGHARLPSEAVIPEHLSGTRGLRAPWPGRRPDLAGPVRVPRATGACSGLSVVRCGYVSSLTSPRSLVVHGPGQPLCSPAARAQDGLKCVKAGDQELGRPTARSGSAAAAGPRPAQLSAAKSGLAFLNRAYAPYSRGPSAGCDACRGVPSHRPSVSPSYAATGPSGGKYRLLV